MVAPTKIGIEEADTTRLLDSVDRVERGEVIELVRAGETVAGLTAKLPNRFSPSNLEKVSSEEFIERWKRLRASIRKHNEGKPPITFDEIKGWIEEGRR